MHSGGRKWLVKYKKEIHCGASVLKKKSGYDNLDGHALVTLGLYVITRANTMYVIFLSIGRCAGGKLL